MPVLKRILYLGLYTLLLTHSILLSAQTSAPREYQIKSVFLYNFTQFVEWPATAFSTNQAPLVIGILGENPFGSYLEETVSGEQVNGHPLVIQQYQNVDEIKTCHILFISTAEMNRQPRTISGLKGRNILTVSDAPGFLQQGGMIWFFTRDNKIQLQINLEAAKAAELVISSKLLRLAEIFVSKKNNN
jgi:hypothetical protein